MKSLDQWLSDFLGRLRAGVQRFVERARAPRRVHPASTASVPPLPPVATVRASVLIPALNEAKRIADVVAYALADPATAEVIVIDDSSIDDTAELARQAGAK